MNKVYPLFDDCQCYFCDMKKTGKKSKYRSVIELHHIKEKHQGGDNTNWNLVPVCSTHHSMVHEGWIEILGWCFSTKGWVLRWKDKQGIEHFGRPSEPYFPSLVRFQL